VFQIAIVLVEENQPSVFATAALMRAVVLVVALSLSRDPSHVRTFRHLFSYEETKRPNLLSSAESFDGISLKQVNDCSPWTV